MPLMNMPLMSSLISPRCSALLGQLTLASTFLALGTPASAVEVRIDPGRSSVSFISTAPPICDLSGQCSVPTPSQVFSLSGHFEVVREAIFLPSPFDPASVIDITLIHFDSAVVDAGGAAALGFVFPDFAGVVAGTHFSGSDDACAFFPGVCAGWSWSLFHNTYEGDFDGQTLILTGQSPLNGFESFTYSLVATTVPEPGALACLLGAGLGWLASRRRGLGRFNTPAPGR